MDMNDKNISRRGFLKTAAAIGTAMAVEPMQEKVLAANRLVAKDNYRVPSKYEGMQYRRLGSGRAAMTVSALGFGCMGMTYNRSQHPSKEQMTRLLHEAVSRGVTLFDTAIIYGPLHNEEFVGEALAPYKNKAYVSEWAELEQQVSATPVVGDRYGADQQKQVM